MPYAPDLAGAALDGRYELHALIGEGTFGRVYRGVDRRLRRTVAIKVIKPWWGEDPEWAERFEREAQLLARVSDPGIVQIFDVGQSDEGLYYVAELVTGESLAARLRRGPLRPADAAAVAEQLCRALAHTHACGVIHRDIKPANVLMNRQGTVKLSDFSIARLAEGSTEGQATIAGTPKYMAPEQARGLPATPATDLYSVGVVLYEMLAGHPPFASGTAVELALRHLGEAPPSLPAEVPAALRAVVDTALAKDPARRHPDALAMASAIVMARSGVRADRETRRDRSLRAARAAEPASAPATGPVTGPAAGPANAAATPSRRGPAPAPAAVSPGGTHVAGRLAPRRNADPPGRRRAVALVALVVTLAVAMLLAARLIGTLSHVAVPDAVGQTRSGAERVLTRAHLRAAFTTRYATAPAGTAIAQSPVARRRVASGATVDVVLSAGPPPVALPSLAGSAQATAAATLSRLGLHVRVLAVPAPGSAAGTVTAQAPGAGEKVAAGSTVTLSVAQAPQWRPVTSFSGPASPEFTIRGQQWRVVYRMSYVGTCTFILFCSGPTARVRDLDTGQTTSFDLNSGSDQVQTLTLGPGRYRVEVQPGDDTTRWSLTVQDYF